MTHVVALLLALQQPTVAMPARIEGPVPSRLLGIERQHDTLTPRGVAYNWQQPALVGGGIFGGLGTFVGYFACNVGDSPPSQPCPVIAEESFLVMGTLGGTIGGLLGSTSHPPPAGAVPQGNHGKEGALWLALPSGVINALAVASECRPNYYGESCSGAMVGAVVNTAINALLGYLIGRSQPRYTMPAPPP